MDAAPTEPLAPDWLKHFSAKSPQAAVTPEGMHGFYLSYPLFSAVFVMRGTGQLVVSFDNLSTVNDRNPAREAWGASFLRDRGWSSLGILSYSANWYRDPALFALLNRLQGEGFFARFARVGFTGTSMGGYGAAAFSGLAPGSTVVAFSPQSTLKKTLVPWEKRFSRGRKEDWSGPYADGAEEVATASRVYLVYDPEVAPDRMHADRFQTPNVVRLKAFYSGHKSVVFLRRAEILKQVMGGAIEGTLTGAEFYRAYRARKPLPWYSFGLLDAALGRERPDLADRMIAFHTRSGRQRLADNLTRKVQGFAPGAGQPEADDDDEAV